MHIPIKSRASSQPKKNGRGVDALLGSETAEKAPTVEPKKV